MGLLRKRISKALGFVLYFQSSIFLCYRAFCDCRALLQRISAVLTAPPKIDDGEYLKMRKICASLKSSGGVYEKKLQEKKTKEMFAQIKKIGPYYNPKQWELDYRRQLVGQKFMRQVNYKRPKDFVDPYAVPVEESYGDEDDSEVRSKNGSLLVDKYRMVNAARSYSHMSVCRNVKRSNSSQEKQGLSKSTPTLSLVSGAPSGRNSVRNTGANNSVSQGDDDYGDDDYGFDEEDGDAANGIAVIENSGALDEEGSVEEKRVMLAEVTRSTKIFDPSYSADHSFPLEACIECFLLDNTTSVVIAARTMDSVGGAPLVAEAEIDLNELSSLREDLVLFRQLPATEPASASAAPPAGMSEMTDLFAPQEGDEVRYEYDMKALNSLAVDIVNTVEIRVEDSIPRLVLNISLDNVDMTPGSFGSPDGEKYSARGQGPTTIAAALGRNSPSPSKRRTEESIAAAVQQSGSEMEDGLRQSDSLRVRKEVVLSLGKAVTDAPHGRMEGGGGAGGANGGAGGGKNATETDEDIVALARSSDKLRCVVTVCHVADDKVGGVKLFSKLLHLTPCCSYRILLAFVCYRFLSTWTSGTHPS